MALEIKTLVAQQNLRGYFFSPLIADEKVDAKKVSDAGHRASLWTTRNEVQTLSSVLSSPSCGRPVT